MPRPARLRPAPRVRNPQSPEAVLTREGVARSQCQRLRTRARVAGGGTAREGSRELWHRVGVNG